MNIGFILGSTTDEVKREISKQTKRVFEGDRSVLKQVLAQMGRGDKLVISSVTDIGDSWDEILCRVSNWKTRAGIRVISIIEEFDSHAKKFAIVNAHYVDRVFREREEKRRMDRFKSVIRRSRKLHPRRYATIRKSTNMTHKRISEIHGISLRQLGNIHREAVEMGYLASK